MAVSALLTVMAIAILFAPTSEVDANNSNPFTVVDGTDYASLTDAITAVPDNGTIEVNTSTSITSTTINASKTFTLDLKGNTITLTSGSITIKGGTTMNIESSVEGGAIYGTGGTIITLSGGTLNILSGTIDRADGNTNTHVIAVVFNSGSLTIGQEGSDVGPHLAKVRPNNHDVKAYGGIIEGPIYSAFGEGSTLNCYFENSPNSRIPQNMVTTYDEQTGYWTVQPYTSGSQLGAQASITHADNTVTYYSSPFYAASEMKDGEILTLLADYVGDAAITLPIYYGTLDLGKYSITKTWTNGDVVATSHNQNDRNPDSTKAFIITGESPATITGPTPVALSAGTSNTRLLFSLEGSVSLVSSTEDECIDVGTGSFLVYTEEILPYVTGTAFKATVGGIDFIYGTAGSAIRDSDDAIAVMLNDCNQELTIIPNDGRMWTLDLGGHTIKSSSTNGTINIDASDAKVTIRNGTVEGTYNGIFIGIPANNGTPYHNIGIILDDITIKVTGDYAEEVDEIPYGINTNGLSTGMDVTLTNCVIDCAFGLGIYFPADGELKLHDTKVSGASGIELRRGSLEISGDESSVTATSKSYNVIGNSGGPNMTGAAISVVPYGSMENNNISVSISGNGHFEGTVAFALENKLDIKDISYNLSISGGYFTSTGTDPVTQQTYPAIVTEEGEVTEKFVTGGTFISGTSPDSSVSDYVDDNYQAGEDGSVEVKDPTTAVATINDRYFATMDEVLEYVAINDGCTVVFQNDVTITHQWIIYNDLIIDLNDNTITNGVSTDSMIVVRDGGNLTILDTGTEGKISDAYANKTILGENESIITIESGQFYKKADSGAILEASGSLTITGGHFTFETEVDNANGYAIRVTHGASAIIENVDIDSQKAGILVRGYATDIIPTTLTVNNAAINSYYYAFAVWGYGYTEESDNGNVVLTVENATVNVYNTKQPNNTESAAFGTTASGGANAGHTINIQGGTYKANTGGYFPSYGEYNISGGEFDCSMYGFRVAAGTVNISGSTEVTVNVADDDATLETGSKPTGMMGPLTVGKQDDGYPGDIEINITGGTLTNTLGNAVTVYDDNMGNTAYGENNVKVEMRGGTIAGDIQYIHSSGTEDSSTNLDFVLDGGTVDGDIVADESVASDIITITSGVVTGTVSGSAQQPSGTVLFPGKTTPQNFYGSFTMPSAPADREGYEFKGYCLSEDGSTTLYDPGDVVIGETGEITVYEIWQPIEVVFGFGFDQLTFYLEEDGSNTIQDLMSDTNAHVAYDIADETIATVGTDGLTITVLMLGSTTVTATGQLGDRTFTDTFELIVMPSPGIDGLVFGYVPDALTDMVLEIPVIGAPISEFDGYTVMDITSDGDYVNTPIPYESLGWAMDESNYDDYEYYAVHYGGDYEVVVEIVNVTGTSDGLLVEFTGFSPYLFGYIEKTPAVDPEPDTPVIIPDDDDYVPLPPTVVIQDGGDDDMTGVAACAAAAVAAAIIAAFLIMEYRKD